MTNNNLEKKIITSCQHVEEFVKAELEIILPHLPEHKYFQHIEDNTLAIEDFNDKYGFVMREMYCSHICKDKEYCKLAKPILDADKKNYKL